MSRDANWLLIGAALLLLGGGGIALYDMTRGLRNNNPGNIRYDGTAWEGLADPPSDGTFAIFTAPEYGIRAMARILTNYTELDGLSPTLTNWISRWAPPSENDTSAYISDLATYTGLNPDQEFDVSSTLPSVVAGIIRHENGIQPYAANTLASGIALA